MYIIFNDKKSKRSHKAVNIKVLAYFYCLVIKGSGYRSGSIPHRWLMDPDPGGPKTCGSGGSGFGFATIFRAIWIRIRPNKIIADPCGYGSTTPLYGNGTTRDITGYTFRKAGIVNGRNVRKPNAMPRRHCPWQIIHKSSWRTLMYLKETVRKSLPEHWFIRVCNFTPARQAISKITMKNNREKQVYSTQGCQ